MQEVIGSNPIFSTKGRPLLGGPFPLMPFATYILYSPGTDRYYVGQAADPQLRLEKDHNGGRNKSTRAGRPWELRWVRWFESRALPPASRNPGCGVAAVCPTLFRYGP